MRWDEINDEIDVLLYVCNEHSSITISCNDIDESSSILLVYVRKLTSVERYLKVVSHIP